MPIPVDKIDKFRQEYQDKVQLQLSKEIKELEPDILSEIDRRITLSNSKVIKIKEFNVWSKKSTRRVNWMYIGEYRIYIAKIYEGIGWKVEYSWTWLLEPMIILSPKDKDFDC